MLLDVQASGLPSPFGEVGMLQAAVSRAQTPGNLIWAAGLMIVVCFVGGLFVEQVGQLALEGRGSQMGGQGLVGVSCYRSSAIRSMEFRA